MLFLGLSVLCSVLLGFIFKLFGKFQVDTFQAIVFNYFTCVLCGWLWLGQFPIGPGVGEKDLWMPYALFLGVIFITGFTGAALTVKHFGVTVSQVMQKMSILITVPFAILVYHESAGWLKIMGIFISLAAIILVNMPDKKALNGPHPAKGPVWIPALTWLLSGLIEITFLWVQGEQYVDPGNIRFISTVFGTAGTLGLAAALWGWVTRKRAWSWRNPVAGIVLGIPNFGSMYFLLLALSTGLEGSFVFPVINVGIILTTAIGAVVLFKEHLTRMNWLGVLLALLAILAMGIF